MPTPVFSVAEFIIEKSDRISNLKLQKLLYYAQGWHLALKGVPLFDAEIKAWVHGPVVPAIFQQYRDYGWHDIEKPSFPAFLIPAEEKHVLSVMKAYGKYSGDYLKWMTHNERPWLDARKGLADSDLSNEVISKESMRVFFESKARRA